MAAVEVECNVSTMATEGGEAMAVNADGNVGSAGTGGKPIIAGADVASTAVPDAVAADAATVSDRLSPDPGCPGSATLDASASTSSALCKSKPDVLAPPSSPEELGQWIYSQLLAAVFRELGLFEDEERGVLDVHKQVTVYHHAAQLFKLRGAVLAALLGASEGDGRPRLPEGPYARAVAHVKREFGEAGIQPQQETLKRVFGAHATRSVDLPNLPKGCSGGSCVCLKQRPISVTADQPERGVVLRFSCQQDPLLQLERSGAALLLTVAGATLVISPQLADPRALVSDGTAGALSAFIKRENDAWAALLQKSAVAFTKASADLVASSVAAKPAPSQQPPATPEKRREEPSFKPSSATAVDSTLVTPQKSREADATKETPKGRSPASSPMASPSAFLQEAEVQPPQAGQRVYAALLAAVFWECGLYLEGPGGWLDVRKQLLVYRHAARLQEIGELAARALQPESMGEEGLPALYAKAIEAVRADPSVREDLKGVTAEAIFDKQHAIHFASPAGVPLGDRRDVCVHLKELPHASGYGQRKNASWWRYLFKFRCAGNPLVKMEEQGLALVLSTNQEARSSFSVISPLLSQPEPLERAASAASRTLGAIGQALERLLPAFISEQGAAWAQFTLWHSDIIQRDSLRIIQKTIRFIKHDASSEGAVDPCFGALEELKRLEAARQQISELREAELAARARLEENRHELEEREGEVGTLLEYKFDLLDEVHKVKKKAATKRRHLESQAEETQAARDRVVELSRLVTKEKGAHKKLLQQVAVNESRIASLQATPSDATQDFNETLCERLRVEAAAANEEAEKAIEEATPGDSLRAEVASAKDEVAKARVEVEKADKRANDRVGKAADQAAETKRVAEKARGEAEEVAARSREDAARAREELAAKSAESARLSASNVALRSEAKRARADADLTSQHAAAAMEAAFEAQDAEQRARDALAELSTAEGTAQDRLAERMAAVSALAEEVSAAQASSRRGLEAAERAEAVLAKRRTEVVQARGRQEAQQGEVARLKPAVAALQAEVASLREELGTTLPVRVAAAESGRAASDARLLALNTQSATSESSPDEAAKLAAANTALRAEAAKALDEAKCAAKITAEAESEAATLRGAEAKIRSKAKPGVRAKAKELKTLQADVVTAEKAAREAEEASSAASLAGEPLRKAQLRTRAELQAKSEEVLRLSANLAEAQARLVELEGRQCEAEALTKLAASSESLRTQASSKKKEARQADARSAAAEASCTRSRETEIELKSELEARSSVIDGLAIAADASQAEASLAKGRADELVEGELAAELVAAEAHAAQQQAQDELDEMLGLVTRLEAECAAERSAKRRRTAGKAETAAKARTGKPAVKGKRPLKHSLSNASSAVRMFRIKGKRPLTGGITLSLTLPSPSADAVSSTPPTKTSRHHRATPSAGDVSVSFKRRRRSKGPDSDLTAKDSAEGPILDDAVVGTA